MNVLIPFSTTYLCKMAFSALLLIKNNYETKRDVEKDLPMTVPKVTSQLDWLYFKQRANNCD